jgi:hypothetical protein
MKHFFRREAPAVVAEDAQVFVPAVVQPGAPSAPTRLDARIEHDRRQRLATIPEPLHASAREALDAQEREQIAQSERARELLLSGRSLFEQADAAADAVAAQSARIRALEEQLEQARRRSAELQNRAVVLRADATRNATSWRQRLVPPFRLFALRGALQDEQRRLELLRIEPVPLVQSPFSRNTAPDARYPSEHAQAEAHAVASHLITEALMFVDMMAQGKAEPPSDLGVWLDDVLDRARGLVRLELPEGGSEPPMSPENEWILKQLATGATAPLII